MSANQIHSTGRGGAGNIGPDDNVYTDGGIVREGFQGEHPDGAFSTGRGGAGNLGKSPRLGPEGKVQDHAAVDYIPENSLRNPQDTFHTGRGGSGNVYKEKYGGHSHPPEKEGAGLTDKVKHALGLEKDKKADGSASPLAHETKN
ncbi:hypothetical protein BDV95DRAFT_498473 [Massariosphaeria phaeospora]|uniref:Uncharacterized protein n=1 Tax=Massariosphaeria phaeospora TaxID=100035 RepID=A0A7C8M3Y5_9PLEO|nr:hypothetical protein BDV95DRAFT_498473 [Massariosphaeria phaeospora]